MSGFVVLWETVITIVFISHLLVTIPRLGLLSLDSVFSLSIWILASGTFPILSALDPVDQKYAAVVGLGTVFYFLFSSFFCLALNGNKPYLQKKILPERPGVLGIGLLLVSILVTAVYYQLVGYNVFAQGLSDLASGSGGQDYTSMRLNAYDANSQYLFPGYVNQFKNSLLPALSVAVIAYVYLNRLRGRLAIAISLSIVSMFALLGTGQRSMMIMFGFLLIVFIYHLNTSRFYKRAIIVFSSIVPPVLFSTLLLGRSETELEASEGVLDRLGVLFGELFDRVFYVQQWSGQMVFHYTETRNISFGSEWGTAILGILPGFAGTDLAHTVFYYLFGTTRGTATPSIWGSVFYNFGWTGLVVVPFLLALLYQVIGTAFAKKAEVSVLQLVAYAGFCSSAGNWIASGPEYLLNSGAATFAVLYGLACLQLYTRREKVAREERPLKGPYRLPMSRLGGLN